MCNNIKMTPNEIVESLKHSNTPTLIVEGKDDLFIYRWLVEQCNNFLLTILPCGGRVTLLEVYKRKEEFKHIKSLFIADKDMYRFNTIPEKYQGIVFTKGYAIENDLYSGSILESFLEKNQIEKHHKLIQVISKWFAFEVEKFRETETINTISHHINYILSKNKEDLSLGFCNEINYKEPQDETLHEILGDYALNIRGKQLLQALTYFLSYKGRFVNFSDKHLMEIALKTNPSVNIQQLSHKIKSCFE